MQLDNTRSILKVSELNAEVALLLQSGFPLLWVEGEISNLSRPSSGHWYFTLKDAKAQVRCAMFKNKNMLLKIKAENGLKVLARVRVGLYEARGEFQLIVEHMEDAGEGQLQKAFETLKKKLLTEGLFEEAHKKQLPYFPRRIGVITSPTGAAIRDVINVLKRRCPSIPVLIYPVPVQGEQAAPNIVKAIQQANHDQRCDVLLVARGGGSLEDLWAFNEESVARAIYDSDIPIVSGVGHEIDFTIADFVSDQRAPTPSAAAELISPDSEQLQKTIRDLSDRLEKRHKLIVREKEAQLSTLSHRLKRLSGLESIQQNKQRIDELEVRLTRSILLQIQQRQSLLIQLEQRVLAQSPIKNFEQQRKTVSYLRSKLLSAMQTQLELSKTKLQSASSQLNAISPLATLERGYVIAQQNQQILRSVNDVEQGQNINIMLSDGNIDCEVLDIHKSSD